MSEQDGEQAQRPVLRVVRGNPDDAEVAALAAALTSAAAANAAAGEQQGREPLSMWADPTARLRPAAGGLPLPPGPNSWRASGLPL